MAPGSPSTATAHGPGHRGGSGGPGRRPRGRHFPFAVVLAHGLFAVVTLVLVLLTALGTGGS
ncbi:hypothetical protein GCM10010260_55840 [Streptomyces filipinensis]|uniref:Uncharacterized protein n=1 Tax=Streptomyces filipinensis TaxID=66887 RepID=A0A918IF15_9ACTN|nr:hypothetical protein [Streptomyces filipinensis]GGV10091.1 hypothetical protein GCM10010260_55840 [Streptomyces filipinensis]